MDIAGFSERCRVSHFSVSDVWIVTIIVEVPLPHTALAACLVTFLGCNVMLFSDVLAVAHAAGSRSSPASHDQESGYQGK
jgi:hypothetical protein